MVKLYKIKFIKDFDKKKIGDIANCSKKNAEAYIKNGYAEYVEEPIKTDIWKRTDELISGEKINELSDEGIMQELKNLASEKSEIIKERKLKTLKKKTDLSLGVLKKELERIEIEPEKSPAIKELTKRAGLNQGIQAEVWQLIASEQFDKATEKIVDYILGKEKLYTIRDDNKPEIFIYKEGVYVAKGKSYIREICRQILRRAYTDNRALHVMNKLMADTYIDQEDFFKNENLNEVCLENGILNLETKELQEHTSDKFFFNKVE